MAVARDRIHRRGTRQRKSRPWRQAASIEASFGRRKVFHARNEMTVMAWSRSVSRPIQSATLFREIPRRPSRPPPTLCRPSALLSERRKCTEADIYLEKCEEWPGRESRPVQLYSH
jgi:hypothetical protein